MCKDEFDSLDETVFWRSQPGVLDDVADARRQMAADDCWGATSVRARYGLLPR